MRRACCTPMASTTERCVTIHRPLKSQLALTGWSTLGEPPLPVDTVAGCPPLAVDEPPLSEERESWVCSGVNLLRDGRQSAIFGERRTSGSADADAVWIGIFVTGADAVWSTAAGHRERADTKVNRHPRHGGSSRRADVLRQHGAHIPKVRAGPGAASEQHCALGQSVSQ